MRRTLGFAFFFGRGRARAGSSITTSSSPLSTGPFGSVSSSQPQRTPSLYASIRTRFAVRTQSAQTSISRKRVREMRLRCSSRIHSACVARRERTSAVGTCRRTCARPGLIWPSVPSAMSESSEDQTIRRLCAPGEFARCFLYISANQRGVRSSRDRSGSPRSDRSRLSMLRIWSRMESVRYRPRYWEEISG